MNRRRGTDLVSGCAGRCWMGRRERGKPREKELRSGRRRMAVRAAGIREGVTGDRNEPPLVALGVQTHEKNPIGGGVARPTIVEGCARKRVVTEATRTDDEFPNAGRRIGFPVGVHRSESFATVVVPGQDDLRARLMETVPGGFGEVRAAVQARDAARDVPTPAPMPSGARADPPPAKRTADPAVVFRFSQGKIYKISIVIGITNHSLAGFEVHAQPTMAAPLVP